MGADEIATIRPLIVELERLGIRGLPGISAASWKAGTFGCVAYDPEASADVVARFVDQLLGTMLGCGESYPIDAEILTAT